MILIAVMCCHVQMHKQQSRGELSRHTWHRQESDESSESTHDDLEGIRNFPRSNTFPCAGTSNQEGAALQSSGQRRYGGTSGNSKPQV